MVVLISECQVRKGDLLQSASLRYVPTGNSLHSIHFGSGVPNSTFDDFDSHECKWYFDSFKNAFVGHSDTLNCFHLCYHVSQKTN